MLSLLSIIYSNNCLIIKQVTFMPGRWGHLLYKSARDAQRKIKIKPLGETILGVAQAQLTLKETILKQTSN